MPALARHHVAKVLDIDPDKVDVQTLLLGGAFGRRLELDFIAQRNARQAYGTPDVVRDRLASLLASTGADELMVASGAAELDARLRSLEIVAELFAD